MGPILISRIEKDLFEFGVHLSQMRTRQVDVNKDILSQR